MSLLNPARLLDGKYQNPVPTQVGGFKIFFTALPRMLFGTGGRTPRPAIAPFRTDPSLYATAPANGLRITWFGHSGTLLEIDGYRILIDPIWEQRASPFQWAGPKRFWPPTMPLSELPQLDAVLISHDHYDHLGEHTIAELASLSCTAGTRWITSLRVTKWLRRYGVPASRITELNWTESTEINGLKITSWPARHFSGRSTRDRFTTLWGSFVIEGPQHRVYYGADSGYWDGFAEIAAQYDRFDLTMLEIGAFDPLWEQIHLGPDNAARAWRAMGGLKKAGMLMPIHWGLFSLGLHTWRQPMERLEQIAADIPLWSPEPGLPTEVAEPYVASWWRK